MLNLSCRLKKFFKNNDIVYLRDSINELKINDKTHLLVPSSCRNCDGQGKHLYGSLKGHCFTSDDMAEDPDFFDDMREGKYDITCNDCDGEGYYMILADNENNKFFIEELENETIAQAEYEAEIKAERMYFGNY